MLDGFIRIHRRIDHQCLPRTRLLPSWCPHMRRQWLPSCYQVTAQMNVLVVNCYRDTSTAHVQHSERPMLSSVLTLLKLLEASMWHILEQYTPFSAPQTLLIWEWSWLEIKCALNLMVRLHVPIFNSNQIQHVKVKGMTVYWNYHRHKLPYASSSW